MKACSLRETQEPLGERGQEVPAGELIRFIFSSLVEVEAELGVDAQTKVVVHLHDL